MALDSTAYALVGERLTLSAFQALSGVLAGHRFVKTVVDRSTGTIHFIDSEHTAFHVQYVARHILGMSDGELEAGLDAFNDSVYQDPDRRFYLGILALHSRADSHTGGDRPFLSLETTEADTMSADMLGYFYGVVREHVDAALPVLLKPANHLQEHSLAGRDDVPCVSAAELFSSARFVPLNTGKAQGRLRAFRTEHEYRTTSTPLEWHDIVVMHRVPDDIPRVAGIVNAHHTTPLSHTNVLASGWQIPNAIQLDVFAQIDADNLDGQWVEYTVDAAGLALARIEGPAEAPAPPWRAQQISIEAPEAQHSVIAPLSELRMSDRYRYGTKAANLGELLRVLAYGSERLLGYYSVPRWPRPNLLTYLTKLLPTGQATTDAAWRFLREHVQVPRGVAIPFSVQRRFLESSPAIQQGIGKLKMALELDAREIDALCLSLQQLIRATRMTDELRHEIDTAIVAHLGGVSSFVVRSSSNAEDLAGFSAAGIYESTNHNTTAANIVASIKEVWASLVSPRAVRLRQQAGISLDDCYMGVIVQEEVAARLGGVLVTTNPTNRADIRTVYVNVSTKVTDVVSGAGLPMQYLYNTLEGGGRTLSLGDAETDLDADTQQLLANFALASRFLQAHFSPDYTFSSPVDIEWAAGEGTIHVLQLRPYAA
jgi:hypothetical protein